MEPSPSVFQPVAYRVKVSLMQIGRFYKHENCTDACIYLLKKPLFIPEKKVYLCKIRWFNCVNPKNIFDMDVQETIQIKPGDWMKWKELKQS